MPASEIIGVLADFCKEEEMGVVLLEILVPEAESCLPPVEDLELTQRCIGQPQELLGGVSITCSLCARIWVTSDMASNRQAIERQLNRLLRYQSNVHVELFGLTASQGCRPRLFG